MPIDGQQRGREIREDCRDVRDTSFGTGDPASIIVHVFKDASRNTAMSIEKMFGE